MTNPSSPPSTRASWPLVTLGALGFIPVLGFFFSAAALTWALNSSRPKARLAGWLAAISALANVALIVGITIAHQGSESDRKLQAGIARKGLREIVVALEYSRAETGGYPATLAALQTWQLSRGHMVGIQDFSSGFHFPQPLFTYRLAPDGASYDLLAVGPDGQPDTEDDIRPMLSDSLREHSGYRPAR